jgi:hypothetical protein
MKALHITLFILTFSFSLALIVGVINRIAAN